MRVLFICGRELDYVRNKVIYTGLIENKIDIINCTSSIKYLPLRYIITFTKFLLNNFRNYDVIFLGFYGQPLVPLVRLFSKKPLLFEPFISSYETLCFDRKVIKPKSMIARFFYWLDKYSCDVADKILLDTNQNITFFSKLYSINRAKFEKVSIGADNTTFYPTKIKKNQSENLNVVYYSSFQPLHGTEVIIQAIKLLENHPEIKFTIIGKGIETPKINKLISNLGISNINLIKSYKYRAREIGKADICLGGHFGRTSKARRVISGKTFHFLAMKKPVIVGDNLATRELLTHRKNAYFCKMNDPDALAKAILDLKNSKLRKNLSVNGYKLYNNSCCPKIIGKQVVRILNTMLAKHC